MGFYLIKTWNIFIIIHIVLLSMMDQYVTFHSCLSRRSHLCANLLSRRIMENHHNLYLIIFQGDDRRFSRLFSSTETSKLPSSRRQHTNKYEKYSNKKEDPLEMAKVQQERMKEMKNDLSAPIRGTTVPIINHTMMSLSSTSKNNTTLFPSYDNIIPSDPYTFGFVQIGTILGPHGVKGEVKVKFETDFIDTRIKPNSILYIKRPNRRTPRPIVVHSGKKQVENIFIVKFTDIRSRFSAMAFKEYKIYVHQNDRPVLHQDEYLIRDLIDLSCYLNVTIDSSGKQVYSNFVGTVVGVIPPDELCDPSTATFMHAMLEIQKPGRDGELCLIPFVPAIVPSVDYKHRAIILNPPKGLLELTYIEQKKVVIRGFLPEIAIGISDEERSYLQSLCS